jgi:hypothetical protein
MLPSALSDLVLLFALTFALYRLGDIWVFQVVLFPLWSRIRSEDFPQYHQAHFRSIVGVIFLPMGLQLMGAFLLCIFPPAGSPAWLLYAALLLQFLLLLSLAFWVPFQLRIAREGNSPALVKRLVRWHWSRVANITAYAAVVLFIAWMRLRIGAGHM